MRVPDAPISKHSERLRTRAPPSSRSRDLRARPPPPATHPTAKVNDHTNDPFSHAYSSIHRLATLTASRQLALACAHLASAGAELPVELARSCAQAVAVVDAAQGSALPLQWFRWSFLFLVGAKAVAAACYLGLAPKDSSAASLRACDFGRRHSLVPVNTDMPAR